MTASKILVQDRLPVFLQAIKALEKRRVLVGIPADHASRKGEGPNNATLLYIHEHGAPEANIPARRPLSLGLKAARQAIVSRLKSMGRAVLRAKAPDALLQQGLDGIGLIAASAVRKVIVAGLSPPLKAGTLMARARSGKGRKTALAELAARQAGQDASSATAHPLLHTGELKNAITHVVR